MLGLMEPLARVFTACMLAVPCCFLINFSNPLAVAKDERNGNLDSTSE